MAHECLVSLYVRPGLGGRFIEMQRDGAIFEIGRITLWEPPHRLVFSWRQASFAPEEVTEVEVRFEPKGDQTQVTVEHRGWDRVPETHVARHTMPEHLFLQRHGEYWRDLLARYSRVAAALERNPF